MPCFQLLRLALLLRRDSGNLDFVQLVVELLIEAEYICLTDILAHGFLLQHISSLRAKRVLTMMDQTLPCSLHSAWM